MPIKGLTDKTPSFKELGRLRLGAPKSQGLRELPHFRPDFRPDCADAAAAFAAAYGAAPTAINIRLPFPQVERCWDAYYEVYNTSGMLGKADGERWLYLRNNKTGELLVKDGVPTNATGLPVDASGMSYMPFDKSVPVYSYTAQSGKNAGKDIPIYASATGRLKVLIPELKRAAYVQVITHSVYNIVKLSEQLAGIEEIAKNAGMSLSLVPMVLTRRKEQISVSINGRKAMQEKYLLNVEIDPVWMEAQFGYLDTLLPGGPARPALVAPAQQALSLPETVTERDLDETDPADFGDADSLPPQPEPPADLPAEPAPAQPPAKFNGGRPYTPGIVKEKLSEIAKGIAESGRTASEKQRSFLRYMLEQCFAGESDAVEKRKTVSVYLTGKASSNDIPDGYVIAMLDKWLSPTQDSGGEYHVNASAVTEAHSIYQAALVCEGQQSLF